ncbi:SDR family NAD(P)-dependent oxidoreductase [Pseudomonas helleri]|uniref:NADP-dependent 3-hydroxy acid dehydrogenase YdfG n=1 Tax=Pseudomonas helleri TaxID=1608996 RepID=A0A6L5HZX4_9PSED|nr:SDR family oxidoreductase [Pseudomonas helleri]MQU08929.1 SDR family NAD(P)-dependent oxidoreductase [Pseudomonas helleri]
MPYSKTAVVTGASSGIGAVYADRLAARGYDLVLVARRGDRLAALSEKLTLQYGIKAQSLVADLGNDADVAKVEERLISDPSIQLLVNNAGFARLRPLADSSLDDSLSQINVNITALTRLAQAALKGFRARKEGILINIASVLAVHSLPVSSVYSGTKAYVLAFSRGLQEEFSGTGIKVQVVMPAATDTEIWTEGVSGIPLSALSAERVMTAQHCVDAALAGLDADEQVTWPSVADAGLWHAFDTARSTLFDATQVGAPAPRYNLTK